MENRNYYSLHCLQMETQLIYANVEILYDVLGAMAETQAKSHTEVCKSNVDSSISKKNMVYIWPVQFWRKCFSLNQGEIL